jgi:hypothetical protein
MYKATLVKEGREKLEGWNQSSKEVWSSSMARREFIMCELRSCAGAGVIWQVSDPAWAL